MNNKQKIVLFLIFLCLGGILIFLGYVIGHNQALESYSDEVAESQEITSNFLDDLGMAFQEHDVETLFDLYARKPNPDGLRQRLDTFNGVNMTYLGFLGPLYGREYTLLFRVDGTPPAAFQEAFPHWELLTEDGAYLALEVTVFEEEDQSRTYFLQNTYARAPYTFI